MPDKDMTGVLFNNNRKEKENQPDFTGNVIVNDVEYRLAGWKRKSKKGMDYLSLAVSEPREERQEPDEEVPF